MDIYIIKYHIFCIPYLINKHNFNIYDEYHKLRYVYDFYINMYNYLKQDYYIDYIYLRKYKVSLFITFNKLTYIEITYINNILNSICIYKFKSLINHDYYDIENKCCDLNSYGHLQLIMSL